MMDEHLFMQAVASRAKRPRFANSEWSAGSVHESGLAVPDLHRGGVPPARL